MNRTNERRSFGLMALAAAGALAVALAAAAQTSAQTAAPTPGPGTARPFLRALKGGLATVGVTDDQKTKIAAILESKRDAAQALQTKARTDGAALKALANSASPDPAAVGQAFLTLKGDRDAAQAMREDLLAQVKGVLTADQAVRLDAYLAAVKQMGRARFGRG